MRLRRAVVYDSYAMSPKKQPAAKSKHSTHAHEVGAASEIDARIKELQEAGDWRGDVLARVRTLIRQTLPEVEEDIKWRKPTNPRGVPVWSLGGIICTGELYKDKVKITFARGAAVPDPAGLFNASLDGNARRAIDIFEGEKLNSKAFRALVKQAAALNAEGTAGGEDGVGGSATGKRVGRKKAAPPRLLSGGNPQIAKAHGDEAVQAYIEAMPGWKRDVGQRLDAIITRAIPTVRKAVKWNTPLYGVDGPEAESGKRSKRGESLPWMLSFHCFDRYIKVAFFKGSALRPQPPVASKQRDVRYWHVHEGDEIDERRLTSWVKQASELPGEWM